MEITVRNLERFTTWMVERGRGENTAAIYRCHLRKSSEDPKGITARLLGKLAPKTKRTNLAALAAWAKFSKDDELRDRIEAIRLPPARRVTTKLPLAVDDWKKLVRHLRTCKLPERDKHLRHVLVIIAIRGLRCSDTLRITKPELKRALETKILSFEGKGRKRTEFSCEPYLLEVGELAGVMGTWETLRELVSPKAENHRSVVNRVWRRMKSEAKRAGVATVGKGVYPHQLRRTYATNFLAKLAGDPQALIKLQKHMHWESLATAATYADAVDHDELDQVGGKMVEDLLR